MGRAAAGDVPAYHRAAGRAVQVDSIRTRAASACGVCNQRLKPSYHTLLSTTVDAIFNVRRYQRVGGAPLLTVGRCRLTVSRPVLTAPMLSTLEIGTS
jgi:hypothetical protein